MIVVGITGLIGTGKTMVADALCAHQFTKVKMAEPLKTMLRSIGMTDDHIEGSLKEKPNEMLCGQTPRYAMQTLGTEWGRQIIGEDVWVNLWAQQARDFLNLSVGVVADDVRFKNEAQAIRGLGGVVIRLERDGVERTGHKSEEQDFEADYTLHNNGSPEGLIANVRTIVTATLAKQSNL